MSGSPRRVPTPLLVLLAVCVVEALAWCIVLPPLQGPDEVSHVAYVQKIVEAHEIPWSSHGDTAAIRHSYSTQLIDASVGSGIEALYANREARPAGTPLDEALWDEREARLDRADRADGGYTSALSNPPAYYLYQAVPYLASSPLGLFDQLFVMRLANIPLLLVVVSFVWLIAGELLGWRRWLQTLAAGAVALQPQLTNVTATVDPDVFLSAVWCTALYLMIVVVKRGLTARRTVALVALVALSGLTHGRGLALVVPAVLTVALAARKAREPDVHRPGRGVLIVAGLGTIAAALAFVDVALRGAITIERVRQLGSYLWQFYLPRPDFLTPIGPDYGFREVVVERFFGGLAHLEVNFSPALDDAIWWGLVAIAASAAVALVRHRRSLRERWDVAVVLVSAPLATFGLLHAVAFRSLVGGSGDPIIAGRYLLALAALYGTAIALAVSWLPRRLGVAAGGALLAALVLLQLGAIGITVERFYA